MLKPVKGSCPDNRRVDVLAFAPAGIVPSVSACAGAKHPGCTTYDAWMQEVTGTIDPADPGKDSAAIDGPGEILIGEEVRSTPASATTPAGRRASRAALS